MYDRWIDNRYLMSTGELLDAEKTLTPAENFAAHPEWATCDTIKPPKAAPGALPQSKIPL